MHAIVIEHVQVSDLPETWRKRLQAGSAARVTIRIEEETSESDASFTTDDPAFGIWRDRDEITDVGAYVQKLREPRYKIDASRKED